MEGSEQEFEEQPKRKLSPVWLATGAVALVVIALLGYSLVTGPSAALQVGQPAPQFQLTTFGGDSVSLNGLRGQVVVLNVFASWCNPCRQEAPDLEQVWREYEGRGVQFLGIAYKDAASKAQAFLAEFDATYPGALDPGSRVSRAYGVTGVPETFVIDQQGVLVRHVLGAVSAAELRQEIDKVLSQ
ncbi:MAG: TlpA family protein disulfide reductase [Anaerolineae bacterium]|jgi:cytochrome c biogenesis protein CcmG/thiol:disulfide interchange protein DsbE